MPINLTINAVLENLTMLETVKSIPKTDIVYATIVTAIYFPAFILYETRVVQTAARGPYVARDVIFCGPLNNLTQFKSCPLRAAAPSITRHGELKGHSLGLPYPVVDIG